MASYINLNIGFIFFLIGIIISIKIIHKRSFKSLITPKDKISWKRFFIGFAVYFILVAVVSLVEYFMNPSAVILNSSPANLVKFLPIAVILTLIQTSTEELFGRGYIIQTFGRKIKNPIILSSISGVSFILPYFRTLEMTESIVTLICSLSYYFLSGFILAIVTIKSNSLELALGAHFANNFFGVYVMNFKGSVLEGTETIFLTSASSPLNGLPAMIALSIGFYFILFKVLKIGDK